MKKLMCLSATLFLIIGTFINTGCAILCWDCNSAHDPRCGEHHFGQHSLGFVDCEQLEREHLKDYKAQYCRKIIQKIGEQTRTIRGCGWLKDTKAEAGKCYTRTGTKDVMVTYCQCEGNMCNTAPSSLLGYTSDIYTIVLLVLVKLF